MKRLIGNRRALAAAAIVAALAAVAAVSQLGGSGGGGTAGAAAAGGATGMVERRTLAERLTASGTIGYAGESTVMARLSGTLTWLPAVGDVVRRGERLCALDGEPVVLMYGEVPAYRELAEGISDGEDVRQLEENLAALGYEPGTVDEEFSSTTGEAVRDWQEDLDLEATGAVELGRVAFLPGPRRVTGIEATLGESLGSGGGGGALAGGVEGDAAGTTLLAAYQGEPAEPGIEDGQPTNEKTPDAPAHESEPESSGGKEEPQKPSGKGDEAPTDTTPSGESEAPATLAPETVSPRSATPSAASPEGGGEAEPGGSEGEPEGSASVPILQTTSTRRIVSVLLEPDQQSVARRGQRVGVLLPGGEEARGEVRRLEAVESASEEAPGGEAEAALEVTVALVGRKKVPALDGATVSVVFTQRARADVLAVPLTALLATGPDRFAVVVAEGANRRRIEVTPGLAADGYVEVEGKGLREGMRVEVAE